MFLIMAVVALFAWRALPVVDNAPVAFRYVGVTNYNERAYVIFAISNRLSAGLRGYTFPIMASREGWVAARATASNMSYQGQRDIWAPGTSASPNNVAVVVVPPPTTNVWRLVLSAPGLGTRQTSRREQAIGYFAQHGYYRMARWLMPPPPKPGTWSLEQDGHSCLLGPEMRGTQLK
jgi:hypothetical protein